MDLPEPHDRLNSWKEIAAFLGRTVRTVQRWEKTDGLPVRRGGPGERGVVVASKREIGEWWDRRRATLQGGAPARGTPLAPNAALDPRAPSPADSPPRHRAPLLVGLLTVGVALVMAAPLLWRVGVTTESPRTGRLFASATSEGRSESYTPLGAKPYKLALSPTNRLAYVSLHEERAVAVVDLVTRQLVDRLELTEQPALLALSPDGARLLVTGMAGELAVFDLRRRTLARFMVGGLIQSLHLSQNGRQVWLAMAQAGLKILDLDTGQLEVVPAIGCPMYLAAASRSRRLFLSYQCGGPSGRSGHDAIEILDEITRKPILARSGPPLVGSFLAVSPDEQHIWSATADACTTREYDQVGCPPGDGPVLHAFRSDSLETLLTIRLPGDKPDSQPLFHPDGSRLAVIGSGVWIIDRSLGTVHESINRHFSDGAFTVDGRRFVTLDLARRALVHFDPAPLPDAAVFRGVTTHWSGDGSGNDVIGGTHAVTTDQLRFESGRFGQAFSFNGEPRGVDFGRRLDPNLAFEPGTYAAWIKPRRMGVRMTILSRTPSVGSAWSITPDARLSFCVGYGLTDLSCENGGVVGRSTLRPDVWHHVAVVRSASALTLFVDGREDGSETVRNGSQMPDPVVSHPAVLRLGAGANGSEGFYGLIDEVLLFRRSLTANDLAEVMRATWLEAQEGRRAKS